MHRFLSPRGAAWWIFLGLLAVYHVNGDYYPVLDARPSAMIAESMLDEGNLSISPDEMPRTLHWKLHAGGRELPVRISHYDDRVARLFAEGSLTVNTDYCRGGRLIPTVYDGIYINTFGPGAGMMAVPVFAALRTVTDPLSEQPTLMWYTSKLVASLCVAGSAAFVFLIAIRFVPLVPSLIVALSYGLGTCVWSTSSQALWQHGPNQLYLAIGVYCFLRIGEGTRWAVCCALALAAATCCRPTSAVVVVAVGIYLLWTDRRALIVYVLSGLPLGIALLGYNTYYLGSPFEFGQLNLQEVAFEVTGSREIWQTPVGYGLFALMVSPSRGLFVYSPFLIFALAGVVVAWRDPRYILLRPLSLAILAIWIVEAQHFDWWGGWSYGYRHLVDTVTLLVLFLIPVMGAILRRRELLAMYVPLVAWSIFVQVLGAFAYNLEGWNARRAFLVQGPGVEQPFETYDPEVAAAWRGRPRTTVQPIVKNVDRPEYRYRLWELGDSQIVYYATHWSEARRRKREFAAQLSQDPETRRAETYLALGQGWLELEQYHRAIDSFRLAYRVLPELDAARVGEAQALTALFQSQSEDEDP